MLLEISGEITPKRMKRWSQSKINWVVMDVTGDGNKVQCCKEQYCIGTWNVRSMNQGKLQVNKQDIQRKQWHLTPVFLPGKSHGCRSLVCCSPWGHKELDTTEQLK